MDTHLERFPYHAMLREVGYILSAQDEDTCDALMLAATWDGLSNLTDNLRDLLSPHELVRIRSRLSAVQAHNEQKANILAKRLRKRLEATLSREEVE